jgi:hypothetical protein
MSTTARHLPRPDGWDEATDHPDHIYLGVSPGGCVWWAHREWDETDAHLAMRAETMRTVLAHLLQDAASGAGP